MVVVSLMTQPEPAAQIDSFFARLQTPSDETSSGPLLLVNLLKVRSAVAGRGWRVFREDLGGFAIGWVVVAVLVATTALMLKR